MRPICAPFETVVPAGVLEPPDETPELMLDLVQPATRKMATLVALQSQALSRPQERNFMGVNRPLSVTPETGEIQERGISQRMAEL